MPDLVLKRFDTFPPVVTALESNGALIDLSTATSIKFIMKGTSVLVTGAAAKLTVVNPTANVSMGSNILTSVSSFTSVVQGGSITGQGIPPGARVSTFDTVALTITMTDNQGNALNGLSTTSAVTLTINKGCVSYTWGATDTAIADTYSVEHEITWSAGVIQTLPNSSYGSIQVIADLEDA
jgi:hypothetical protein